MFDSRKFSNMENIIQAVLQYENKPSFVLDYDSAKHHVNRWLDQFDDKYKESIIAVMDALFEKSFITRDGFKKMCINRIFDKNLTRNNPAKYWSETFILDCQLQGESQTEMVKILKETLKEQNISFCENENDAENLLYIDDMAFTFGRITQDLKPYKDKKIDVLPIISHSYNDYYFRNKGLGTSVNINTWHCIMLENRVAYKNNSQVFWPHVDSLGNREFQRAFNVFNCRKEGLRDVDESYDVFSDPLARKLCEEAFFIKGAIVLVSLADRKNFKPLGISPFKDSWGFGGSVFSYRNCPNTTPIVIWWGDYYDSHALWYPLMLRKGYNQ